MKGIILTFRMVNVYVAKYRNVGSGKMTKMERGKIILLIFQFKWGENKWKLEIPQLG